MKKIKLIAFLLCIVVLLATFSSCGMGKAAMEYKGRKISANMYSYWMSDIKGDFINAAQNNDSFFDTSYNEDMTYEDWLMEAVNFKVKSYLVCMTLFEEYGLKVDDSIKEHIELAMSDLVESYGSKNELNLALAPYDIDYNTYKEIMLIEYKYEAVYEYLYGDGGPRKISDEQIDEYYKENYLLADMIVIYTGTEFEKDKDGNYVIDNITGSYKTKTLTEEEKSAKKALADDIMNKINNGEDFDALKKQYNEDVNKNDFVDGYYISPVDDIKTYGTEIIMASQELETGESTKVEGNNVVYIIKRKELKDKPYLVEKYYVQFSNILTNCQKADFGEYMTEMIKDVKVKEKNISKYSIRTAPFINF